MATGPSQHRATPQGAEPRGADQDATAEARSSRAVASFMRTELLAPVEAVGGFVDLLAEDVARLNLSGFQSDVDKMQASRLRLGRMMDDLVGQDAGTILAGDVESASAKLRHDLRTPIAAVLGYAELLSEEAREDGIPEIGDTLNGLIEATRRLLEQIDTLVQRVRHQVDEGDEGDTPAALARQQAHAAIRAVLDRQNEAQPSLAGHILVVDDDQTNLDLLSRRLSRDGHTVHAALSGTAALEHLEHENADIILLDLIMPGLTGLDVLQVLRERDDTRQVPVIIISGLDESDGAIRCIEAGADDYLAKPVDPVLLRARINAALERKQLRDREIAIAKRLEAERERSENLLRNVLPASVVERLRGGETVIADEFASATILFCDLVGFTALSAGRPPAETLDLLNAIFSAFDRLAGEAGVEKIKTIGDAYMAAGGLSAEPSDHAAMVTDMALRMPGVVSRLSRRLGVPLTVRVGLDTGPVVAGIIGTEKFLYDVWGDTVNTASRMEHHGVPGRVHITDATRLALGNRYAFERLEPIEVKGKGLMQTFLIR